MTDKDKDRVVGGRCGCNGPVCGPPNPANARRTSKKAKKDKENKSSSDQES